MKNKSTVGKINKRNKRNEKRAVKILEEVLNYANRGLEQSREEREEEVVRKRIESMVKKVDLFE